MLPDGKPGIWAPDCLRPLQRPASRGFYRSAPALASSWQRSIKTRGKHGNEWMNGWVSEWMDEWVSDWMNELKEFNVYEWIVWMNCMYEFSVWTVCMNSMYDLYVWQCMYDLYICANCMCELYVWFVCNYVCTYVCIYFNRGCMQYNHGYIVVFVRVAANLLQHVGI